MPSPDESRTHLLVLGIAIWGPATCGRSRAGAGTVTCWWTIERIVSGAGHGDVVEIEGDQRKRLVGDAMLVVAVDDVSGGEDEAVEGLGVMGVVGNR